MGYLPCESHWDEFNRNEKNPQVESCLLPVERLSVGTSEEEVYVVVHLTNTGYLCSIKK